MYIPLTFEGSQAKCLFASGGYEGFFISGSQQWKYHWFTGSAVLEVQKGTIDNVQIYVIGGGGGGGGANTSPGGGGGGGGVNYTMNARLFQGTYNVAVGRGGFEPITPNSNGFNGVTSSFIGTNLSIIAGGGGGGLNTGTGGTGGSPNGGNGGNGGTTTGGNGSLGIIIYLAKIGLGFGCGGGGAKSFSSSGVGGLTCNGGDYGRGAGGSGDALPGAEFYGMGGGGGNGSRIAENGASGSVIIQYPIYDYCTNYFNETGSCGCRQITFDVTDGVTYNPYETGSYIYMPCGETSFESGSLFAYGPLTVCAVSNSYYSYTTINEGPDPDIVNVIAGFVTSGSQCISASLTPAACSPEAFVPTCTSSIVTIYTPSASVGNVNTFGYVAKNETTHSQYSTTDNRVKYICISTGSIFGNGIQIYPKVLSGNFTNLYNTASCRNITLVADWAGKVDGAAATTYNYYPCDGIRTSVTLVRPTNSFTGQISASFCRDMSTPAFFQRSGVAPTETFISGSDCLNTVFSTGSCGCP